LYYYKKNLLDCQISVGTIFDRFVSEIIVPLAWKYNEICSVVVSITLFFVYFRI